MNLITDTWLPVITHDGLKRTIAVSDIANPDIIELNLPRPDFQGAAYQLLIGLLQTTFAPSDVDEWLDYYDIPPTAETLSDAFNRVTHAFSVIGDGNKVCDTDNKSSGVRFMQDLDDLSTVKTINPISGLLIEAPGDNTLKLNKDFFIKRDTVNQLSLPMAALALFTLQINAPSGGVGHRTGLRGGGPMTTLVRPSEANSSLWHKLWLNVINRSEWDYPDPSFADGSVFPWLAPTRVSDTTGEPIYSKDETIHPLHVYWAMPRRIRLMIEPASDYMDDDANGSSYDNLYDDLTGELIASSQLLVRSYRTQNYGANYEGDWSPHPFTPYRFNPKKPDEAPFSIKAQPGGITYKLWHMLTFNVKQDKTGVIRARVLDHINEVNDVSDGDIASNRIWAFSYDMDNMKARGFYSAELPIYHITENHQDILLETVLTMHGLTETIVKQLRDSIKYAWMSERQAKDTKGDMSMIDTMFWQRSERLFFTAVESAINHKGELPAHSALTWLNSISELAITIYEEQVLSSEVIRQRHMQQLNNLRAFLYGNKQLTQFRKLYQAKDVS